MYSIRDLIFYNFIKEHKNIPIIFWGASLFLNDFLKKYELDEFNILGVVDVNSDKWGCHLGKYQIYPIQKLEELHDAVIIPAIINNIDKVYQEIAIQVNNLCPQYKNIVLAKNVFQPILLIKQLSNHIYFVYDDKRIETSYIEGLHVIWEGTDSVIEFRCNTVPQFINTTITMGNNCRIVIGDNCYIKNTNITLLSGKSNLCIGDDFFCAGGNIIMGGECGNTISIGDDCMFSSQICIRSSDGHTIYNNQTGQILNLPTDVKIGNHVWLGNRVTILKNVNISDNTVVAANSLVNKSFQQSNVLLAGSPAKIVRENINWKKEATSFFKTGYVIN